MTRNEATHYCTRRWHSQCELYPTMGADISLARYIRANLKATMQLRPESKLNADELRVRSQALGA